MNDALARTLPRPADPSPGPVRTVAPPASWPPGRGRGDGPGHDRRTIAVVGACGGAGVSTVAVALAQGLRRAGDGAVLVDLDLPGPGLDVLLGIEDEPGARWPELAAARGDVDGVGLVAALPRWHSVPVLSGTRSSPGRPDDAVVVDVCTGLLHAGETVVLDVPRPAAWTAAVRMLVAAADVVLLVVPCTAPGVAGAMATWAELVELGVRDPWLVARRPAPGRVDAVALGDAVGLPVATTVRADARLAAAVDRGDGPPVGRGTPLGRAVAPLVTALAGAS
ncbi:septum site-determining protein Ssd [Isoptericola sp. NPDC019693]|uniref:septum site-determining protein Ssd n=1 Tax=Isoptericola sp. NPDC019693 TaxID=3364009 RepID=UPI0037A55B76